MPEPSPMFLKCENCDLVSRPPLKRVIGYECPNCRHKHFETHRDTPICDFCCAEDLPVTSAYPARDFNIPMPKPGFSSNSRGWWAACSICADMIESGKRAELAERSGDLYIQKHGMDGIPRSLLYSEIRKLHDQFWENREGPPVEALPTEGAANE